MLLVAVVAQSVGVTTLPVMFKAELEDEGIVHPRVVCIVAWLIVLSPTPSTATSVAATSMQREKAHTFNDVNLASCRPVRSVAEKRRPSAATSRHVY